MLFSRFRRTQNFMSAAATRPRRISGRHAKAMLPDIFIGRTHLGQRKRQVPVQLYAAVCHGIVTVENEHGKTIPGGPWGVNTNHP